MAALGRKQPLANVSIRLKPDIDILKTERSLTGIRGARAVAGMSHEPGADLAIALPSSNSDSCLQARTKMGHCTAGRSPRVQHLRLVLAPPSCHHRDNVHHCSKGTSHCLSSLCSGRSKYCPLVRHGCPICALPKHLLALDAATKDCSA